MRTRGQQRQLIGRLLVTAMLFACSSIVVAQKDQLQNQTAESDSEFSVHEWGVFTVPRGAAWAKQDMLLEWQSFPSFFHGTLPGRRVKDQAPMIIRKPVIFFHCEEELNVDLLVRFSEGQPMIWWPPTEFPSDPMPEIKSHLPKEWKGVDEKSLLLFETRLNGSGKVESVPADHWVNHLRKVKSATVSVMARDRLVRGGGLVRRFAESFIYYDGLFRSPASPVVQ